MGEFGQADAAGIAVGLLGEAADEDPGHLGEFLLDGAVVIVLAPDDVGVHSRAADVLADGVDDE